MAAGRRAHRVIVDDLGMEDVAECFLSRKPTAMKRHAGGDHMIIEKIGENEIVERGRFSPAKPHPDHALTFADGVAARPQTVDMC